MQNSEDDCAAVSSSQNPSGFSMKKRCLCSPSEKSSHTEASFRCLFLRLNSAINERSSYKERRVDALALRAEERRDKLRKAAVRSKYPVIRGCLNGETRQSKPLSLCAESIGVQGEPRELKHLSTWRKRKKTRFPE